MKEDRLPWDRLLAYGKNRLDINPSEFWKLTFGEWWPLYNASEGKKMKPMTHRELESLEDRWQNVGAA